MYAIIAMLFNVALRRWHPIIFLPAPTPGDVDVGRYKSKMHHTAGFETRAAALAEIDTGGLAEKVREHLCPQTATCLDGDIVWDGEGIPAHGMLFTDPDSENKVQCASCTLTIVTPELLARLESLQLTPDEPEDTRSRVVQLG